MNIGGVWTRRTFRAAVPVISLSLLLAVNGNGVAAAAPQESSPPVQPATASASANAIAELVAQAAPEGSTAASEEDFAQVDSLDLADEQAPSAGDVLLPSAEDSRLTSLSTGVTVTLPALLDTSAPQVSDDGLVVYEAEDTDDVSAAVAVTDVSASVQVVIPNGSAPTRYVYELDGARPILNPNGSVLLLDPESPESTAADGEDASLIGLVEAPWAVDANGVAVPTRFEIRGGDLVQVVELDETTAFPVVADPDFIWMAKCGAAIALFIAENSNIAGKFWRVFKSRKALVSLFKGLKGMKMSTKVRYVANRLGSEVSKMSGIENLVPRCTP